MPIMRPVGVGAVVDGWWGSLLRPWGVGHSSSRVSTLFR